MSVQPTYLVVEKLVDYNHMVTSQHYIDEYQMCRVKEAHELSGLKVDEQILVGNKIFFDSAKEVGNNLFFIFLEEVYGVIRGESIVPMEDFVYIETDKSRKSVIKDGEFEYFNDTTYNPHHKDNVVQDGIVHSVCTRAKDSYFFKELDIEIAPGDHIYTHHFLTDSDNEREFNGKTYYEIRYENLYCKVIGEEIIMLNEWNFITPIPESISQSESGIILEFAQKNKLRIGKVNHLSKSLYKKGVNIGDTICFKQGREYEIIVEGNTYYRINSNDIIYKLD